MANAEKDKVVAPKGQLLGDMVLIEQYEAEGKSKGGIVLPDASKTKPFTGKVLLVGPGRVNDDGTRNRMTVKPGDEIYYNCFAGVEIKIGGEKYVVIRESDIIFIAQPQV